MTKERFITLIDAEGKVLFAGYILSCGSLVGHVPHMASSRAGRWNGRLPEMRPHARSGTGAYSKSHLCRPEAFWLESLYIYPFTFCFSCTFLGCLLWKPLHPGWFGRMIIAMRLKRKIILPQNYSAYLFLFGCGSAASCSFAFIRVHSRSFVVK